MRDLFIGLLEKLIAVIIILMGIGVVVFAVMAAMNQEMGGILGALGILVGGALYIILIGGGLYLAFGIYHNTRRTAEACENMANR
jgi:threonine/homoserine/homoserine lactone efflux protein